MNKTIKLLIFFVIGFGVGFGVTLFFPQSGTAPTIDESENQPESSGRTTQYFNASSNDIVVNISDEQQISSPITITGQAVGPWFFEATAPVSVVNWDGLIIGEGYIEAQGTWMTENFVPFTGTLNYTYSGTNPDGWIIINNANASGEPQFDKAIEIPVQLQ